MKKLVVKNKLMIQVILGFLFSLLVFGNVLFGNDKIDRIIASNMKLSVILFISIIVAALFTNFVLDYMKNGILEKPNLLISILKVLNYQVFLFALLYFFMDTLFNNVYIQMPFDIGKRNPIVNVAVLIGFAIVCKLRNKESTKKQWLITVAISSILILQINYIEMIFLSFYFLVFSLMKRESHRVEDMIGTNSHRAGSCEGTIVVGGFLIAIAVAFCGNIYGFFAAFVVISIVVFIMYQSKELYLSFRQQH